MDNSTSIFVKIIYELFFNNRIFLNKYESGTNFESIDTLPSYLILKVISLRLTPPYLIERL